jgi:hypothetical protein
MYKPYYDVITRTAGTDGMVHLPFAVTPIGVFFNQQVRCAAVATGTLARG